MKNSFEKLENHEEEQVKLPEEMEMQLFAQLDSTRTFGNLFGNFFEQITGLITMLLGKKKNP